MCGVQLGSGGTVQPVVGRVAGPLEANGGPGIQGEASFETPNTLIVKRADGDQETMSADRTIIASGSVPVTPPIDGLAEVPACVDSSGALSLAEVSESLLVSGGGVIGLVLASVCQ